MNNEQKFIQGRFKPKHPEKYLGDVNNIIFRSSWELKFNTFLDSNPNILKWGSEVIAIPYIKPTDQKIHTYYVDYIISYKTQDGDIKTELIEIKPAKQTKPPRKTKNINSRIYESITFAINQAKWAAAEQYAKKRGWIFRIITEEQLFR